MLSILGHDGVLIDLFAPITVDLGLYGLRGRYTVSSYRTLRSARRFQVNCWARCRRNNILR